MYGATQVEPHSWLFFCKKVIAISVSKPFQFRFKNGIKVDVARNKVMACLIPYLKIPLNIGDFIFATSANFSKIVFNNVNRVAGVARFLGLCGKLCHFAVINSYIKKILDTVSEYVYNVYTDTMSVKEICMPRASEKLEKERKNEIINACAELYRTKSFKDIRFKDIAGNTSFTRTSIYNYYKTKEEIFLALFEREYQDFNENLFNLIETNETLSREKLADELSSIIEKRVLMLKLLAINIYDMEENSRKERLVDFKIQYGKTLDLLRRLLKKYFKKINIKEMDEFIFSFLPFLHGVYPYVFHTKKQTMAMKTAKIIFKEKTIKEMTQVALKIMLPCK